MSNTKTEKPYSWMRTDRFTPINSSWLVENLKEVDQSVEDLLTMIEDDDLSLVDVDLVHLKRSVMFDRIKQIYHKHQALAKQYDQILSSNCSHLATTDVHANGIAFTTPDQECQKKQYDNASPPSNISDISSKVVSTFSSSESDSESDSVDSSIEKYETPIMSYPRTNGSRIDEYATVLNKITKYKEELKATQRKLQLSEEEVCWLKIELKKNEDMALVELELEKKRAAVLQQQVAELDSRISDCNFKLSELVTSSKKEYVNMKDQLSYASECFEKMNSKLQIEVHELTDLLFSAEEAYQALEIEAEYLRNEVREEKMEKGELITSLKSAEEKMKAKIDELRLELAERSRIIESLEDNLSLQADNIDFLLKEKEKDKGEISSLEEEVKYMIDRVEISMRGVEELKKEVNEKKAEILDRGEEKREAIRQLCFSLDYYRDKNEKLRKVLVANSKCYKFGAAAS